MSTPDDRRQRGLEKLAQVHSQFGVPLLEQLKAVAPDFPDMVINFAYGEVYARPGLDMKSRQLATLSALVAMNNAPVELKAHIHAAIEIGWTREEIVEVILQMALYAGFPATMNALFVAKEAFAERDGGSGTTDERVKHG